MLSSTFSCDVFWMLNKEAQFDFHPANWDANALLKDQTYLFPSLFDWVPTHSGATCRIWSSDGSLPLFGDSLTGFLTRAGSLLSPAIAVSSGEAREPPELHTLGCFFLSFSLWSESDYLPSQGRTSAKECNPCKAQGHKHFSYQKCGSQRREATWEM